MLYCMKVTMKEIKDLYNELLNNKCAGEKRLVEEKGRKNAFKFRRSRFKFLLLRVNSNNVILLLLTYFTWSTS